MTDYRRTIILWAIILLAAMGGVLLLNALGLVGFFSVKAHADVHPPSRLATLVSCVLGVVYAIAIAVGMVWLFIAVRRSRKNNGPKPPSQRV
jgi:hypothetical protein